MPFIVLNYVAHRLIDPFLRMHQRRVDSTLFLRRHSRILIDEYIVYVGLHAYLQKAARCPCAHRGSSGLFEQHFKFQEANGKSAANRYKVAPAIEVYRKLLACRTGGAAEPVVLFMIGEALTGHDRNELFKNTLRRGGMDHGRFPL